ncbi:hypothetical protein KBC75_05350 [Candidatus Shapirobacteria bacterium]|nr:hypothetical protein [Candidatus Shapirobacteria bacterium]
MSVDDQTNKDVRSVVFLAEVPQSRFDMHHGFESRLNSPYEKGGCGAGMVTEG